jgi:predicted enzyme related to lactoylglutathione lyase
MITTNAGRYVWFELLTTDPKGAIAFYGDVVGWKTEAWASGDYTMWLAGQGAVGGVSVLPEAARKMGAPPYWQGTVEVADVDRAVALVTERGGGVLVTPVDMPGVGRMAVILDPQGAAIAIITPSSAMASHDPSKAGEFSWSELYTTDHEAAFRFYEELFGWERLGAHDMGPMGTYLLWGRGGKQLGGMMTMPKEMKTPDGRTVPPSWMYYVTTLDLDLALERAKKHGARVLNGPMEVPGGQRIVQLMDAQGAAFALVTSPAT